jgi:hypothetical protein
MTATHGPAEHYGGSSRYMHNQIHSARGKAQLALNASGTWHCTLRQAELLLDDLRQLSDVVGELSAVLAQVKATVTARGGHAHLGEAN